MATQVLNTKAAAAEQTRMLNAKAKQADSPQTVAKQSSTATAKETVQETTAKAVKTARPKPAYITFIAQLIEEGTHTRKELYDKTVEKYPEVAKSTVLTRITDGFNKKYTVFGRLLTKDADGKISFAK